MEFHRPSLRRLHPWRLQARAYPRIEYRTPQQLGLLERFHQTLKTEEVYWQLYDSPQQAQESLDTFRERYNYIRPHWALKPAEGGDALTPSAVYLDGAVTQLPKWQGWARAAKAKLEKLEQKAA
ncbi:MAG: integrase core domain-containing protein [Planctomycetota bacterium]